VKHARRAKERLAENLNREISIAELAQEPAFPISFFVGLSTVDGHVATALE